MPESLDFTDSVQSDLHGCDIVYTISITWCLFESDCEYKFSGWICIKWQLVNNDNEQMESGTGIKISKYSQTS
jgi:hypothetical protein